MLFIQLEHEFYRLATIDAEGTAILGKFEFRRVISGYPRTSNAIDNSNKTGIHGRDYLVDAIYAVFEQHQRGGLSFRGVIHYLDPLSHMSKFCIFSFRRFRFASSKMS